MSDAAPPSTRWGSVTVAAMLLIAAVLEFVSNLSGRAPVALWAKRFGFDVRRPLEYEALLREPYGSLAAVAASEMALADSVETIPLPRASAALRRAWLDSVPRRPEALAGALALVRTGIARRPGFGDLRLSAAKLDAFGGAPADASRSWALRRAAVSALPGIDAAWTLYAAMAIDHWRELPQPERAAAATALSRAFANGPFVREALPAALATIGPAALSWIPDDLASMRSALAVLAGRREVAAYVELFARMQEREAKRRGEEVAAIEHNLARGEVEDARQGCRHWVETYRPQGLDSPEGRREAARVLAAWPPGPEGSWNSGPKADLVRFFLNGRETQIAGPVLQRSLASFPDVPAEVRHRVALLAGSPEAGRRLMETAPEGDPDWTPALLLFARQQLAAGNASGARRALDAVLEPIREDCEGLIVQRELAQAINAALPAETYGLRLAALLPGELPADAWSSERTVGLCLDPTTSVALEIEIASPQEAFVEYGWNGGRRGTVRVGPGSGTVALTISGESGRGVLFLRDLAGGPTRPGRLRIAARPTGQGPEPGL
jgi:hypothetical protein